LWGAGGGGVGAGRTGRMDVVVGTEIGDVTATMCDWTRPGSHCVNVNREEEAG
jgi:hypothetical protein